MKSFVFIACLLLSCIALSNGATARKNIESAKAALEKAGANMGKVSEFVLKINPGKVFAQISKTLVFLGPAMMAVSAVLSIVAIFLPQEDSAELKAIKAGFEKVNLKLDVLTAEIKDLKNIIELSSAKSAYITCVTAIESNYLNFHEATQENEKASYDYFVKHYELSYNLAADNMYDAMTGKLGPFGFNLVNLYKEHVKCNPVLVSKFCTMGMQIITKGLTVEGAYLGALNLTDKAKQKEEAWQIKMQALSDSCGAVIQSCEDNWKIATGQQFRETYNKEMSDDNQQFAEKIAQSLSAIAPQRGWLAVSYNDASGFGEHGFSSYYETDKIWDQHNHDVTVFSAPLQETLTGGSFDRIKDQVDQQRNKMAAQCQLSDWKSSPKNYGSNDLRTMLDYIRQAFMGGVVYSVRADKNPGHFATGNTLYTTNVQWKCSSNSYRIMVFI